MRSKPKAITSPPTKEELNARLEIVRKEMRINKLDYYISFDPVNIYYLTNFANNVHERPFILIIKDTGTPTMLVPLLEKSHVESRTLLDLQYKSYYEFPAPNGQNWYDIYPKLIEKNKKVGIESSLPIGISQYTPGNKMVIDIIDEARIIKTDYEVGRSVHACRVINKGHKELLKICQPGVHEFAIYQKITGIMTSKIITDIPNANFIVCKTTAAVWPPSFSHDPHIIPKIFAQMEDGGPHVSIVYAQVDGYGVEIERTFFLGTVPEKAKQVFSVMYKARDYAYSMLQPGMSMSEIDKKVRKYITDKGYGDYIIHRTGHGLGITGHEAPFLAEGYNRVLEPNMLISVEPGIYIPSLGGFRHSDSVLITEEGYIKLSKAPETLEELTIPIKS
ncbi:MAG: aminopeptidase P family protein [Promethearchaeota archaeon]|nr:MAG: aminopeptidase P family protein [Candidatus Lokiarchaeota archaeon]